ncbi:MAG: hypothetical protein JWQ20_3930, partial [Conexibacter sp.]|nr:hypothetical protein [Conexibacter sp.]
MHRRPAILLATTVAAGALALSTSAQAATNTISVPAGAFSGVDSAHVFTPGQQVEITATGTWNCGNPPGQLGPNGLADPPGPSTRKVPGTFCNVVGSTDGGTTWFSIGAGPARITTSGPLLLAANDDNNPSAYGNNSGSVQVSIADVATASAPQSVSADVSPDLSISVAPTLSLGTL